MELDEDYIRRTLAFATGTWKHEFPGPWTDEPDAWDGEHCGLRIAARRSVLMGMWCGYAGVPTRYRQVAEPEGRFQAHGGINYSSPNAENSDLMPDAYVLGFDCGHSWDVVPMLEFSLPTHLRRHFMGPRGGPLGRFYRDLDYVIDEAKHLAEQMAARLPGRHRRKARRLLRKRR